MIKWVSLSIIFVLVFSISFLTLSSSVHAQSTVLFSDDFESYTASSYPTAGQCNNYGGINFYGGDTGATAFNPETVGCHAPPKVTVNGITYWQPASSGACTSGSGTGMTDRGGCVRWDGSGQMGPNSIWAIVSEKAASGNNSFKIGASDWAHDKTATSANGGAAPAGLLRFSMKIWLGKGIDLGNNGIVFHGSGVAQFRYSGASGSGAWEYRCAPSGNIFCSIGNFYVSTQTWHTLSIFLDSSKGTYEGLTIDGVDVLPNVHGKAVPGGVSDLRIGTWTESVDYQSVHALGVNALYYYIDDVEIALVSSTTTTSSSQTSTTTTTSSITSTTTTSPITTSTTTITHGTLKIKSLGKGIAVSATDPANFKIIKIGVADFETDAGTTTIGVLHLNNDSYRLKNVSITESSMSAKVIYHNKEVGTYSATLKTVGKDYVWYGTLTINGANWNVYLIEAFKKQGPIQTTTIHSTSTTSGSTTTTSASTTTTTSIGSTTTTTTTPSSGTTVWHADFETGDQSQFNGAHPTDTCQNGIIGVSSLNPPTNGAIVHSGNYAGYYSGGPSQDPTSTCREYVDEYPSVALNDYYWSGWFYVPSFTQVSWVSFASFGTGTVGHGMQIDGGAAGTIRVQLTNLGINTNTNQPFPIGKWFQLSVLAHSVNSPNGDVTVYLNGVQIYQNTGDILGAPMAHMHFGVYKSPSQPNWAIYEDDLTLQKLS